MDQPAKPNQLVDGSIIKSLIFLSLPIVIASMLQSVYQLTDAFWVGKLGTDAIAAVAINFPIIFLIVSLGGGLSIAGTILVAQYKGRGDQHQVNYVSAQTLQLIFFASIILSFLSYIIAKPLMQFVGADPDVLPIATFYLQISSLGFVFMFLYFAFESLMRGIGHPKLPLYIVMVTVVLNFLLDPVFIYGWHFIPALGTAGAAFATDITQAISAIAGVIILFSGKFGIHVNKEHFTVDWKLTKKMFMLGGPSSLEQSLRSISMVVLITLVAQFGTVAVAAYGLGIRVLIFVIIPGIGFSIAAATMVGQNIGAGKPDRAREVLKQGSILSFGFLSAVGLLTFIFAGAIVKFFAPASQELVFPATFFVQVTSIGFGLMGVTMVMIGSLRGSGSTVAALIVSTVLIIFQVVIAFVLAKFTPLNYYGIWWAYPISNIFGVVFPYYYLSRSDWLHKKIIDHH